MSPATTEVSVFTNVCVLTLTELAELPKVAVPRHYDGTVRLETKLAYALLAQMLWTFTDKKYSPSDILVTSKGKPYHRTNGYFFSYAHTGNYIACVVSSSNVGLDVEQTRVIPAKLHSRILTTQEMRLGADPLRAWVIKEAYSKLVGEGLGLGFSRYSTSDLLEETNNVVIQDNDYTLAVFCSDQNAKIAVGQV